MTVYVHPTGRLQLDEATFRCALGRGGVIEAACKREGDGATPAGAWALRRVLYRADRLEAPETLLPLGPLYQGTGWCDDPEHELYNRPIEFPFNGSAEHLWRDDHVYDIIVVLGHNDDPPVAPLGSAIFFHLARPDFAPTQGCVAVSLEAMLTILRQVEPDDLMVIERDFSAD